MSLLRRPASPGRCQKDLAIVRPLGFTQWLPLARPLPQLNIAPVRAAILFPEFVSHLAHTCLMVSMVIGHPHSPLTSTVYWAPSHARTNHGPVTHLRTKHLANESRARACLRLTLTKANHARTCGQSRDS